MSKMQIEDLETSKKNLDLNDIGLGCDEKLNQFFNFLKIQIYFGREIEIAKEILSFNTQYNIFDSFRLFDVKGINKINQKDLKLGLQKLGLKKKLDLFPLFKNQEYMSFDDFSELLLPQDQDL